MNLIKNLYIKLPMKAQDQILESLIKTGKVFQTPVFRMLLHSVQFFGGDLEELKLAFTAPVHRKLSLIEICRELAKRTRDRVTAAEQCGNAHEARALYHRAAIYYLVGDWYTADPIEIKKNYGLMMPCYDRFRQLSDPPIEKVEIPFDIGSIFGYFRLPAAGKGPFPAVIIVQGNDEVKEFNNRFEEMALARGLATLNLDPPGWGESGLSGNRFSSVDAYRKAMNQAVDFLQRRVEISPDAIGIFGVSFGGLLAPFAAGLEPRFAAVAGMGGPSIHVNRLWRNVPAVQARRAYLYSGTRTLKELEAWTDRMDFMEILSRVRCPVLVVHGEKDELIAVDNAREIIRRVRGDKELKIVPNGDHMCTHALESSVGPYIFNWLARMLTDHRRHNNG
jgi:2,6-dihydroxypseudooxynicotine hydrolase